jgi:hypothetical protein
LKLTRKDHQLSSSSRAGLGMTILGMPIAALGGVIIAAALREIAIAVMGGLYMETPGLIGAHLFRISFSILFFALGLLMIFGGTYLHVDTLDRQITVRNFYGLFARSKRFSFSDVTQVTLRAENPTQSFKSLGMREDHSYRRPRTTYKVELALQDGSRALLGLSYDKAAIHAVGKEMAELLGVQLLDIGLVGSQMRRTGA